MRTASMCSSTSANDPLQTLAPPLGSSEDLLSSRPSWWPYEHNQRGYDLHCRGQGERHHVARRNVLKHAEDSRSQRKDSLIERHHERDDRTDVGRTKLMLRDKRGKGNNVTDAETKQHATNQYNRGRIRDDHQCNADALEEKVRGCSQAAITASDRPA